jgi:anaerobic C4-dicarboxylate transporter
MSTAGPSGVMLTMTDRILDRARRTATVLSPFVGIFLVVIHGKRW